MSPRNARESKAIRGDQGLRCLIADSERVGVCNRHEFRLVDLELDLTDILAQKCSNAGWFPIRINSVSFDL